MWQPFNPNPVGNRVGDCTVRAICKATGREWHDIYINLCVHGLFNGDMPSANSVWGAFLRSQGFKRHIIPDTCPDCYSVAQFAEEHPQGTYILALSGHVVTVVDGHYYDSWDSGSEVPVYYWIKEN